MKLHLRLTVDVEYETNGVKPSHLQELLKRIPMDAASDGQLTGYSDAEVDEYRSHVEDITAYWEEEGKIQQLEAEGCRRGSCMDGAAYGGVQPGTAIVVFDPIKTPAGIVETGRRGILVSSEDCEGSHTDMIFTVRLDDGQVVTGLHTNFGYPPA